MKGPWREFWLKIFVLILADYCIEFLTYFLVLMPRSILHPKLIPAHLLPV
jgi:hypothetical protein